MSPIVILIVLSVVASVAIAFAGAKYRFGFWGYLFASLLLTPLIGALLLAAAIPPRPRPSQSAGEPPRR